MDNREAVDLIVSGINPGSAPKVWVDLGCGSGMFSLALASILPDNSKVLALDRDPSALEKIPSFHEEVHIAKYKTDFLNDDFPFNTADGILMANSLHYVNNKLDFLNELKEKVIHFNDLIIIEYEVLRSNPWVPYPVSRRMLTEILELAGFEDIRELNKMDSRFGHLIYAMGAKRKKSSSQMV